MLTYGADKAIGVVLVGSGFNKRANDWFAASGTNLLRQLGEKPSGRSESLFSENVVSPLFLWQASIPHAADRR